MVDCVVVIGALCSVVVALAVEIRRRTIKAELTEAQLLARFLRERDDEKGKDHK
jgi:hypothetical protein